MVTCLRSEPLTYMRRRRRLRISHARPPVARAALSSSRPRCPGARWVAPMLPEFFRRFPDISVGLHLTDEQTDLIGEGFDAALRIAVMEDTSLVARLIAPV